MPHNGTAYQHTQSCVLVSWVSAIVCVCPQGWEVIAMGAAIRVQIKVTVVRQLVL